MAKKINNTVQVIFLLAGALLLCTKCINTAEETDGNTSPQAADKQFAGTASCAGCHQDIYDKHLQTAHHITSGPATPASIKGNFDSGKNVFVYSDSVKVVMEKAGDNFYQVQYVNGLQVRKEKFDIVVGSGTKGQTYLYWNAKKILQLPVFYYTDYHQWANSPGYPGKVIFNRPITSRCLECHSTYIQKISDEQTEPEDFDRKTLFFGVDCEKCHGPGAAHVDFQSKNPGEKIARFIINPERLSRTQQLNLCALCHGGRLTKTQPSFSFQAGDSLENYFHLDTAAKDVEGIDVHGNQYGLLAASSCFKMSEMTCSSCHNTHEKETGKVEQFSQKCMACHNEAHNNFCSMYSKLGNVIKQNCIDCHMPVQASRAIVFLRQGADIPSTAFMRSHYVKVYPDETMKVIDYIKKKGSADLSKFK